MEQSSTPSKKTDAMLDPTNQIASQFIMETPSGPDTPIKTDNNQEGPNTPIKKLDFTTPIKTVNIPSNIYIQINEPDSLLNMTDLSRNEHDDIIINYQKHHFLKKMRSLTNEGNTTKRVRNPFINGKNIKIIGKFHQKQQKDLEKYLAAQQVIANAKAEIQLVINESNELDKLMMGYYGLTKNIRYITMDQPEKLSKVIIDQSFNNLIENIDEIILNEPGDDEVTYPLFSNEQEPKMKKLEDIIQLIKEDDDEEMLEKQILIRKRLQTVEYYFEFYSEETTTITTTTMTQTKTLISKTEKGEEIEETIIETSLSAKKTMTVVQYMEVEGDGKTTTTINTNKVLALGSKVIEKSNTSLMKDETSKNTASSSKVNYCLKNLSLQTILKMSGKKLTESIKYKNTTQLFRNDEENQKLSLPREKEEIIEMKQGKSIMKFINDKYDEYVKKTTPIIKEFKPSQQSQRMKQPLKDIQDYNKGNNRIHPLFLMNAKYQKELLNRQENINDSTIEVLKKQNKNTIEQTLTETEITLIKKSIKRKTQLSYIITLYEAYVISQQKTLISDKLSSRISPISSLKCNNLSEIIKKYEEYDTKQQKLKQLIIQKGKLGIPADSFVAFCNKYHNKSQNTHIITNDLPSQRIPKILSSISDSNTNLQKINEKYLLNQAKIEEKELKNEDNDMEEDNDIEVDNDQMDIIEENIEDNQGRIQDEDKQSDKDKLSDKNKLSDNDNDNMDVETEILDQGGLHQKPIEIIDATHAFEKNNEPVINIQINKQYRDEDEAIDNKDKEEIKENQQISVSLFDKIIKLANINKEDILHLSDQIYSLDKEMSQSTLINIRQTYTELRKKMKEIENKDLTSQDQLLQLDELMTIIRNERIKCSYNIKKKTYYSICNESNNNDEMKEEDENETRKEIKYFFTEFIHICIKIHKKRSSVKSEKYQYDTMIELLTQIIQKLKVLLAKNNQNETYDQEEDYKCNYYLNCKYKKKHESHNDYTNDYNTTQYYSHGHKEQSMIYNNDHQTCHVSCMCKCKCNNTCICHYQSSSLSTISSFPSSPTPTILKEKSNQLQQSSASKWYYSIRKVIIFSAPIIIGTIAQSVGLI